VIVARLQLFGVFFRYSPAEAMTRAVPVRPSSSAKVTVIRRLAFLDVWP
jgi:hypothetical protein